MSTSKKYQILKSLDDYGTANVLELLARIHTKQTLKQLDSYLHVLRANDSVVEYNRKTMRWSLTDTGEQWLTDPKSARKIKPRSEPKPKANEPSAENQSRALRSVPIAEAIKDEIQDDRTGTALEPIQDDELPAPANNPVHPSGIEPLEIAQHESYLVGNAIDCLMQVHNSDEPFEKIKLAAHYLNREIRRQQVATCQK